MQPSGETAVSLRLFGREVISFAIRRTRVEAAAGPEPGPPPRLVLPGPQEGAARPEFVVNSLLLHDSYRLLMRTEAESLHAVTGSVIGSMRMLERIIPFRLSRQSVVGATSDDDSLAEELIRLNDFGLVPLAYFHSHPGSGGAATHPSRTDRDTQAALEKSGADVLSAIFSRDGAVRFFTNKGEPSLRVLGKRVQEIGRGVYQLDLEENVQD